MEISPAQQARLPIRLTPPAMYLIVGVVSSVCFIGLAVLVPFYSRNQNPAASWWAAGLFLGFALFSLYLVAQYFVVRHQVFTTGLLYLRLMRPALFFKWQDVRSVSVSFDKKNIVVRSSGGWVAKVPFESRGVAALAAELSSNVPASAFTPRDLDLVRACATETLPDRMRPTTARDLPSIMATFGVVFTVCCLLSWIGNRIDFAERTSLKEISGSIESVTLTHPQKSGPKLNIFVRDGSAVHQLSQDDLRQEVPELATLRVGDHVTALANPDFFGRPIDWLWELRRGDTLVVSYDATLAHFDRSVSRRQIMTVSLGLIGFCLLAIGIALRLHFGAWRPKKAEFQATVQARRGQL